MRKTRESGALPVHGKRNCTKPFAPLFVVIGVAIAFALTGCGTVQGPLFRYTDAGERVMFKRRPMRPDLEFFRYERTAYLPATAFDPQRLSADQREVLAAYGAPEHVRKPFRSTGREAVDEWLYLRHNLLTQWVDGVKVYDGPVTDTERTMLQWGYPDYAHIEETKAGIQREIWVYDDLLEAKRQVYSFTNGKLVAQTGWH